MPRIGDAPPPSYTNPVGHTPAPRPSTTNGTGDAPPDGFGNVAARDAGSAPKVAAIEKGVSSQAARLRELFQAVVGGADPTRLDAKDLKTVQAIALNAAQRLFTNQFNDDGPIKSQIGAKQPYYRDVSVGHEVENAVLTGTHEARLADCLNVILRTFRSDGDQPLRGVAMEKLGFLGRASDVDAVLPYVRKGGSADLYGGLETVRNITARTGSPQKRGHLSSDPQIGPLLQKASLTDAERAQVIEAVLVHGEVAAVKKHVGGNMNDVFFITFKETLPDGNGRRVPIRGVWKPERTWFGKDKCFYSREVAAYEFDRKFTKTGLVPPTREAILAIDGGGCSVGSMQFMVPNAKPLGRDLSGMSPDEARRHADDLNPDFAGFVKSPEYKQQEAKLRTLLFIFSDPDKLANNVHPKANLQNIMVDAARRIWMIDNAYSMGAPPQDVDKGILPKTTDDATMRRLDRATGDAGAVRGTVGEFVDDGSAQKVAERVGVAARDLHKKLGR